MNVGGFDLIIDKGAKVVQSKRSDYSGLLGAKNQRVKVVRHLARKFVKNKENEKAKAACEEEKVSRKKGRVEAAGR